MIADSIYKYLGPGGAVQRSMDAFELRPQQLEMSEAVARAFDEGHHLMVEAGTGTGKSLAYLIPAALWAMKHNKKVVVSTYTKTLQQQILNQDIPFLQERLGMSFRFSLCVGYGNYLSLRRLRRAHQTELFNQGEDARQMRFISDWATETQTGLRSDLPFEALPLIWEDVGRQKELCLGKKCDSYNACFYFKARRQWFGSHLLIVNHHLFFADFASGGGVLPRYDAVIFDEAQNVEEVATLFLGLNISNTALFYFLDRLHNPKTRKGVLSRLDSERPVLQLERKVSRAREVAVLFFNQVIEHYGCGRRTLRLYKPMEIENIVFDSLRELKEALLLIEPGLESDEDRLEVSAAGTRCSELNDSLQAFLDQKVEGFVYWLEIGEGRGRRKPRVQLRGVPIDVSGTLKEQVFEKVERVVMTSATLSTNQTFEFVNRRTGFEPDEEMILDSPFNYPLQTLIYVPPDMAEPSEETGRYIQLLAGRIGELIEITNGRTFILFTSYDTLNRVFYALEPLSNIYPLLKQGELSTGRMIEQFKQTPSVILGTSAFWQGVDIPGEALQSVIITKLPFDVPNEPLTEARLEFLRQQQLNPFRHYQIPRAIIQLKQGFGRLIRKGTDWGVVSILDPRLVNRNYGKSFIGSLPGGQVVNDLNAVRQFFMRFKKEEVVTEPGKIISPNSRRNIF